MGIVLFLFLIIGIISTVGMICFLILILKFRKNWRKIWFFFLLYILGFVVSLAVEIFSIFIIKSIFGYMV